MLAEWQCLTQGGRRKPRAANSAATATPHRKTPFMVAVGLLLALVATATTQEPAGEPRLPSEGPQPLPNLQPAGPTVVSLEISGNNKVSRSRIVQKLKTRAGRSFDAEVVERDVRELNKSGLFVSVAPKTKPVEGGVVVTFEVVERPSLEYVKYFGNARIKDAKLAAQTKLKKGNPLSPYDIQEAREKLVSFYHERGFHDVQITVLEGTKPTDKGAVFLVHEGEPQKVVWTDFVGNTIVSDAVLRTKIQSKPGVFWIFGGQVDPKKIDEDVERITAYYRSLGYFRARVSREYKSGEEENWVNVKFYVDEGPRYKIRNMTFEGNKVIGQPELAGELNIKAGDYFDQVKLSRDLMKMRDQYGGRGYVFADVKADPRFLEEPGQLDLAYTVNEGERYRIGEVNVVVTGDYPHTRTAVVRNHLSVRPGDIADTREIRKSQLRLQRSGLFEVDPSKGMSPQLKLVRADEKDGENIARRDGEKPRVRGQSPDGPTDRVLDVYEAWEGTERVRVAVPRENAVFRPVQPQPSPQPPSLFPVERMGNATAIAPAITQRHSTAMPIDRPTVEPTNNQPFIPRGRYP